MVLMINNQTEIAYEIYHILQSHALFAHLAETLDVLNCEGEALHYRLVYHSTLTTV